MKLPLAKSRTGRRDRFDFLALFLVCVLAVVVAVFASFGVSQLNSDIDIFTRHPFMGSKSVSDIRRDTAAIEARMMRLASHNGQEDISFVRQSAEKYWDEIQPNLDYIRENYLGPRIDVENLENTLTLLHEKQMELIESAARLSPQQLSAAMDREHAPLYLQAEEDAQVIVSFTGSTVDNLNQSSTHFTQISIFVFVAFALLIIGVVLWFYYAIRRKNRDIYYRDYLFDLLSENIDDVFLIFDGATNQNDFISANSKRVLGVRAEKLAENPDALYEYIPKEDAENLRRLLHAAVQTDSTESVRQECAFHNSETGKEMWTAFTFYQVRKRGKVERYILQIADLTREKEIQQALRDALINAQNANKSKSDFLSHMSHEIRTPMNAIVGMTTIAASNLGDVARVEDCLTKIASSSRHLLMLINDILDMSKIESGKMVICHDPFTLESVISSTTSMIYPRAREKNVDFQVSVADVRQEELIGDALRLNQVLLNILSNAVKFTPSGGQVRLEILQLPYSPGARFRFTIRDTGVGMSRDFLDRIFVPFEQEQNVQSAKAAGTGLGMAITQNVVTLMNGTLQVESELGKGTVFTVELGFDVEDEPRPSNALHVDKLNVLVVDDDQATCEHTSLILHRIGVRAEWVTSGAEAVEKVCNAVEANDAYDVCFLDWKMEGMDGVETTRQIRKRVGPETLIIIISAYDWGEIEAEARAAGANAFISKPMFQSTVYNALLSVTRHLDAPPISRLAYDFRGKRILLAEDNELNREIAEAFLLETGVQIDSARNGKEAVEKFQSSPDGWYHIILMDIQMPIMDGYQAADAIRRLNRPDAAEIPILAMTANAFAEDITLAMRHGMNAHIAKPIDADLLYREIERFLRRREVSLKD